MSALASSLTVAELRELVRGVVREELARKKHRKLPIAAEPASQDAIDKVRRRLRRQGVIA